MCLKDSVREPATKNQLQDLRGVEAGHLDLAVKHLAKKVSSLRALGSCELTIPSELCIATSAVSVGVLNTAVLSRRPHKVEELLKRVWGPCSDWGASIVDIHEAKAFSEEQRATMPVSTYSKKVQPDIFFVAFRAS